MSIADLDREVLGDRYELQRMIAAGGMGEVWRGRDTLFDRPVAVKLLRSEYAADPTFTARFRAEATHAAALRHPNIAAVHDYGEDALEVTGEPAAYLVMELVDGDPLAARLAADGAIGPRSARLVLRQAAAALGEAHRHGVVHRDVKPANILVRDDRTVKLTDFGIARSAGSVPLTGTGQVLGTPQYMAPEQAMGESVGPASDVYALGLVGYECLTGRPAFAGDNPVSVALQQVRQQPAALPEEVPAALRDVIDAAIAKDPADRIPDGDALVAALEDVRVEAPRTTRVIDLAPAPPPRRPAADPRPAPVRQDAPRRRWPIAVLVLALLSLAGVAAVVLASGGEPGAPPAAGPSVSRTGGILLAAEDYVGRPVEQVAAELTAVGLVVERREVTTTAVAPGRVADLDPAAVRLSAGDVVRLAVAVAPPSAVPAPAAPPASVRAPADTPTTAGQTSAGAATPEPSTADPSTAQPSTAEPTAPEATTAEPSTAEPTAPEATTAEPPTADPSTADPSTADPSTAQPSTADPSTAEPTTAEPSTADPSDTGTTGTTQPAPTTPAG
ncbi:protein kinase [Geodermatophilus sp. SYSU D00691]